MRGGSTSSLHGIVFLKNDGIILALVHLLGLRKVHVADATRKVITETSLHKVIPEAEVLT